ncbi:nitrate reductase, nitrite reductase (NAD(P)H) [Sporocytophaga myxococcoides]|uniref:Nitrate reductase, nitrite reductase (NAD(P)H) n=1 Tax=Sporocytophaga myxococcoides TaxID=153721 RepID=A0A098L9T4_9BACT|nr:FAD-dependent oxidoreductase [Sporocytophaga myxococcoides]GAL82918.1 nitrate reductase, nitrite reductase (NAD(P)H) [Sporocytophaga myxococcoides]
MFPKKNISKTTCNYCGLGCGVIIQKDNPGKITVTGDQDHPVNKGILCSKGVTLQSKVSDHSDRILYPEMRWNRNMPRQRVTWDTALNRAAAVFKTFISKYGPDSVGFYVSGQCLTEEYYLIDKLVKGFLGTNNIDSNTLICGESEFTANKLVFGMDSIPGSIEDLELADCFFITNANPFRSNPILFKRLERYKASNPEVKIIIADSRRTESCAIADIHLQLKPGTEIILFRAIGRFLIENNLIDKEFIEFRTEGFNEYKNKAMEKSLEEASAICDIPVIDIILAAEYIGKAKSFISMLPAGNNQNSTDLNKNLSLINLSLITGQIGKEGCGPFPLSDQPHIITGTEAGGLSDSLPGHRSIINQEHREEIAKYWGVPSISDKRGYTDTELFDNLLSGKLKAIWIINTNPLVSLPPARNIEVALKNSKFVIVQDISLKSETVPFADLILPAAGWLEKEGTITNPGRRISLAHKLTNAPGEAIPGISIISRFAEKMGFADPFKYENPSDIFLEYSRITKQTIFDVSNINFELLHQNRSMQWPFEPSGKSTKILYSDHIFNTASCKANFHSVAKGHLPYELNQNYPLLLTSGQTQDHWHSFSSTGKLVKVNLHTDKPLLEINKEDALNRGIKNGDVVEVFNEAGSVKVTAQYSLDIKKGVVFLPLQWGKVLIKDLDSISVPMHSQDDQMGVKTGFSVVQVKKYNKKKEKIIVIGAGVGSSQFVRKYRALNPDDEIHIFSKEKNLFYNRIMLPGYISGKERWNNLIRINEDELNTSKIYLHKSTNIISIDPGDKVVIDHTGKIHSYDVLILATGSRPALPREVPKIQGIFTMRSKEDADKFKRSISPESNVVIAGGGLLGLELADALTQLSIKVSVVHRSSRLMNKQLDSTSSSFLHEELSERNISFYYNDEVLSHLGKDKITGVKLKSGKDLSCDVLVYTIGTKPNIELAQSAGLNCNRGIVVNEYLRTNNPFIFAIGEVAEFEKSLFESSTAAGEQADVVAGFLNGDETKSYSGTLPVNILTVSNFDICSIGMIEVPGKKEDEFEEIVYIDKSKRYYKKCIVQNDRLVGAILVGDKSEFPEFKNLILSKVELADKRVSLLLSNKNKHAEPEQHTSLGFKHVY